MKDWITARPVAHRGLHSGDGRVPENSLSALEAAAREGYPAEIDVRLLADGAPVVFHDEILARMTGEQGAITTETATSLRRLRLQGSEERIPLLAEVLEAVADRVPLLIEVKSPGRPGALEKAVARAMAGYRGEWAVQSFNPLTVKWFLEEMPDVPRGLLAGDFRDAPMPRLRRILLRHLALLPWARPHFVAYDHQCLPFWPVSTARRAGLAVLAWTIDSPAAYERSALHCDNVIFEGFRPPGNPRSR